MTKKLTWEVEKTSLVLKVTDGDRKVEWIIRKTTSTEKLRGMLGEMLLELDMEDVEGFDFAKKPWLKPMIETAHTVDAEELAELQRYPGVQADTEEASRAAQARRVADLKRNARWMDATDDEIYTVPIPDYDTGEI